jgi:hypothetical protein
MDKCTKYIPAKIIDIFGGLDNILNLPNFDINNEHYHRFRDYPDFIQYDELSAPIMKCVDRYGRLMIIFKVKFIRSNDTITMTEVLFQRYTDSSQWNTATCPSGKEIMWDGSIKYDMVKQVVENGRIDNVTSYHYGIGDYILG